MFLYHGFQQNNNEVLNLLGRVKMSFFDSELSPYLRKYFFTSSVAGIAECLGIQMTYEDCGYDINPLFTYITIVHIGNDDVEVISSAELFLFCYGILDTYNSDLSKM